MEAINILTSNLSDVPKFLFAWNMLGNYQVSNMEAHTFSNMEAHKFSNNAHQSSANLNFNQNIGGNQYIASKF